MAQKHIVDMAFWFLSKLSVVETENADLGMIFFSTMAQDYIKIVHWSWTYKFFNISQGDNKIFFYIIPILVLTTNLVNAVLWPFWRKGTYFLSFFIKKIFTITG